MSLVSFDASGAQWMDSSIPERDRGEGSFPPSRFDRLGKQEEEIEESERRSSQKIDVVDHRKRKKRYASGSAERLRIAARDKAEAEKLLLVKRAEAEAEAKYLAGVGISRQRKAMVDGLRESVIAFSDNVPGTSAKDVMETILITQYFDTLKEIGASNTSSSVFIPHGPGAVKDAASQIRMLQASTSTRP